MFSDLITLLIILLLVALTLFVNNTQKKYGIKYGKFCSGRPLLKEDILENVNKRNEN